MIAEVIEQIEKVAQGRAQTAELGQVRGKLSPGEQTLFDEAVSLARKLADEHALLIRAAKFAEAGLGTTSLIHEIKQCLSPLIGTAALLRESRVPPAAAELLGDVTAQATRIADLVDRHLALFRGSEDPEPTADVDAAVREATRYFASLPPGVSLQTDVPPGLPRVRVQSQRLVHALVNLLANARDAQKEMSGTIAVAASRRNGSLEIVVSDQGAGIESEASPRLFEPLFSTKGEGGTGLGLYLSRELLRPRAEVLQLSRAETPPGAVTAFAVRIPLDTPSVPAPSAVAAAPVSSGWENAKLRAEADVRALVAVDREHRVLIVEDEPAVRRMTTAIVESIPGTKVHQAADARLALAHLEQGPVDFIVCDKNLPDLDGLEVIRRVRERRRDVDAMIITGYPSPESATEAIRMGATDYLLKPVRDVKTLRESVGRSLNQQKLTRILRKHEAKLNALASGLRPHAPSQVAAAIEVMTRSPTGTIAILGEPEIHDPLRRTGLSITVLTKPDDLAVIEGDVDLIVVAAENSADILRDVVSLARARPWLPHLVPIGEFTQTEAAVTAVQGRAAFLLKRPFQVNEAVTTLGEARTRRWFEVRAAALAVLLAALGAQ